TICEYERVKEGFPEFKATMESLRRELLLKAANDWDPLTYGGMAPKSGQFGECPIMPELFFGQPAAQLVTWNQWLTATGHQTLLYGNGTGNTIPEDYKIGLAGIAFLDKAIRVSEIRLQIGDKKLGRINVEEAMVYNKPVIVFENGFICDEEEGFDLYAYVRTRGPQRIKLLGPQLNRVPNKLQVSNTGAALS
ncbi:MAG: hypothetical protein KKB59_18640, partial [Spirochaetes bacterium]|nr:hypothetical protein [Spirochaetota bacterium]